MLRYSRRMKALYIVCSCVKPYPKIPRLAARAKIDNLHTFKAADTSIPSLLGSVNGTFCVEIKWCLLLCVLRATCIFGKDYLKK
jgi:hypothetical protein